MLVAEVRGTLHGKVNQVSTWQLARNPKINTPLKPVIVYMDNPTEARAENKGEDQGPSHVSPMGPADSSRVESSISVGKQVRNGSYHATALSCKGELDLGLVKCFSVGLRCFSGNEPQACRCCRCKHVVKHWQFRPHTEEGLLSAG